MRLNKEGIKIQQISIGNRWRFRVPTALGHSISRTALSFDPSKCWLHWPLAECFSKMHVRGAEDRETDVPEVTRTDYMTVFVPVC